MMIPQELEAFRPMRVAVVVAHPDDEILWCGGLLLSHPEWSIFVAVLCRSSDADRAPRFARVLQRLGAQGAIGDLDDGPGQPPLPDETVAEAVLALLPAGDFDLILTHSPRGEYTRHLRHEEASRAVWSLWNKGLLKSASLWVFAYEDGGRAYLPRAQKDASFRITLSEAAWAEKRHLMLNTYNYGEDTWESKTLPREEAFRCFDDPGSAAPFFSGHGPL